jgi:hypothetical protein
MSDEPSSVHRHMWEWLLAVPLPFDNDKVRVRLVEFGVEMWACRCGAVYDPADSAPSSAPSSDESASPEP